MGTLDATSGVRVDVNACLALDGATVLASTPGGTIDGEADLIVGPAGPGDFPLDVRESNGSLIVGDVLLQGGSLVEAPLIVQGDVVTENGFIGALAANTTLTIDGSFTHGGLLDVQTEGEVIVGHDTVLNSEARFGSDARLSTGGDFVVNIATSSLIGTKNAELRIDAALSPGGRGVSPEQDVEAVSQDAGADADADADLILSPPPNIAPFNVFRVGPGATTANLVDHVDNANGTNPEAVYCRDLIIDAGSTLNINGIRVYYLTLTLDGTVDDPGNLIPVPEPMNDCAADFDGNGVVDGADFGTFGAAFGSSSGDASYLPEADFDGNGVIDGADFGTFGAEFGRTDCDARVGSRR